ncbi:MAG: MAPEG family protein [Pseudomonadales bacterium]|nr:MAPEG family protein [Pseudomonadales bacterium]
MPSVINHDLLHPMLGLICWTFVIWLWMYATRIPAMQAANIDPDEATRPGSLDGLPDKVRFIADNYNHLHEQPTVFYALITYTFLVGNTTDVTVSLAWSYVVLRVVHSLVQCTVNKVLVRFAVFAASSLVLITLVITNLLALI